MNFNIQKSFFFQACQFKGVVCLKPCSPGVVPGEYIAYAIVPVKQPLLNCSSTVFSLF